MSRQVSSDARTWRSHPVRAFLIRAAAFLIPLGVSVVVGLAVGAALPAPQGWLALAAWWAAVLAASTLALYGTDRLTRRLLPLATLMRLSMLFPDHAPSRVKLARRVTGSRAIAAELEKAQRAGITGDRQQAAETILALVGALGDYDSRTRGHSERTQLFVTLLADELKLKAEDKGRLMWAALVHDIGKLKVPTEVLNKPGKPTPEEWASLHHHPEHGAEICEPLRQWLGEWWPAIEQHHEKYDGSGYPRGLAGNEISYGARIVAVADSYEVMTAARPYKRPMTAEAAREELTRCAGTQFDPDVVRAFLSISLGRMSRTAGPIAWIAQLLMVRPGPLLGQVMGGTAGAAAAAAGVVGLNLAPSVGDVVGPDRDPRPPAAAPAVPGPSASPSAEPSSDPTRRPQRPPRPVPALPTASPVASPSADPTLRVLAPLPSETPDPVVTLTPEPTPVVVALVDDTYAVDEDGVVELHVLANDVAGDHGPLRLVAVSAAGHGTATRTVDQTVLYAPARDYAGPDAFSYTAKDATGATHTGRASVTVRPVQDPPVAVDDVLSVAEDSVDATLPVLANDRDPDGDLLSATSLSGATRGTLARRSGGSWGYTPDPDFHGTETLTYVVEDGHGGSSTGSVRLTVTPVNDRPVAVDDTVTVAEDAAEVTFTPAANDTDVDGDALSAISVTGAARGTLAAKGGGVWGYTPDPDFYGTETLSYVVSDGTGSGNGTATGTVRVTVTPVPDAPVAVDDSVVVAEDAVEVTFSPAANDTDADGDPLTVTALGGVADGTLVARGGGLWGYTPDHDFFGTETLTYTVEDPTGRSATGTVTITVTPVPDAPSARPDAYSVELGQTLTTTAATGVLANDHDPDGDALTVVGHDAPFTLAADGSFSWTPSVAGTTTVTYQVSDGGATANGTMTITVTPSTPSMLRLYLEPAADTAMGLLLTTPPPAGVSDWDGDGRPGLTIDDSDMKPDEDNHPKFQVWSHPVTAPLTLDGPVSLDLWTRLEKGAFKDLDYAAWVYDCTAGGTCTVIASAVDVHVDDWSTSTQWEKRTVTVGSVIRAVPVGHSIRVRLAFNHSEVFLPLGDDPATPGADESTSSLNLTVQ